MRAGLLTPEQGQWGKNEVWEKPGLCSPLLANQNSWWANRALMCIRKRVSHLNRHTENRDQAWKSLSEDVKVSERSELSNTRGLLCQNTLKNNWLFTHKKSPG
ncbi:unnamed protein product [Caretta caretta]